MRTEKDGASISEVLRSMEDWVRRAISGDEGAALSSNLLELLALSERIESPS